MLYKVIHGGVRKMKRNISIVKPIGFLMLVVLFVSFMAAINVSVVQAPPHLVINEFRVTLAADESVELYNPTVSSVDLSKWILSDRPLFSDFWPEGEGNMTLSGTIVADGYSVFVPSWPTGASLGNEGDDIYLYDNSTGEIVDATTAEAHLVDKVAYGPFGGCPEPEAYWSACRAPNGIDTDDDAMDWNVNASTGPTMGSANNAPPAALGKSPILINEVLANPSGMPEFIELYNNGSTDVNVNGWFFSDGDDTILINVSSIVPANGFWVAYSNASYWQAAIYLEGLENTEDNLYLFNSTGHRLDQMGWTSDHGDGTSVARFSDGVGQCYAYNDTTLVECGWAEERRMNGSPGSINDCTHIWVSWFYASPSTLRMFLSNYSLVYASIANMRQATTHSVNVTLVLPSPDITLVPPNQTKVELGDLIQYERRSVVWNVTVHAEGLYLLTLNVNSSDDPDPRPASTSIRALPRVDMIFDLSHDQFYGVTETMWTFVDLMREIGYVYVNYGTITNDKLDANVKLLVIPDTEGSFIANETEVIKDWIENKGGSLLIMGTWCRYLTPAENNNITLGYGIEWVDSQVKDGDDYVSPNMYWPIIYTWSDNVIAKNVTYNVAKVTPGRTCMLNISGNALPIATGDTDPWTDTTYAVDGSTNYYPPHPPPAGMIIANGTDVIPFAAVEVSGGGRIFASGSSAIFTDGANYIDNAAYGNKQFARNILAWLMRLSTGEANFTFSTMYNVTVKANLNLKVPGASLVARFDTYSGVYQGNVTVWTGSTPTTVALTENVTIGLPVEMVTLVLTDSSGNIWGAIASFVFHRSDLMERATDIDSAWPGASNAERTDYMRELAAIDMEWPYAPP